MIRFFKVSLIIIAMTNLIRTQAPDFCNGLKCPEYSVIDTQDKIEIREYPDSFWVSTKMKNGEQSDLIKNSFRTLFNYISGKNIQKQKIDMTAPVLVKVNSKVSFTSDDEVATMSFFLGQTDGAPEAQDSNVFLQRLESKRYAIISYSGYSNTYKQEENLRILGDYLTKAGLNFKTDYYFFAGYDSPFKFFNRHNEVWIELL
jgi:hypothetical protein